MINKEASNELNIKKIFWQSPQILWLNKRIPPSSIPQNTALNRVKKFDICFDGKQTQTEAAKINSSSFP